MQTFTLEGIQKLQEDGSLARMLSVLTTLECKSVLVAPVDRIVQQANHGWCYVVETLLSPHSTVLRQTVRLPRVAINRLVVDRVAVGVDQA